MIHLHIQKVTKTSRWHCKEVEFEYPECYNSDPRTLTRWQHPVEEWDTRQEDLDQRQKRINWVIKLIIWTSLPEANTIKTKYNDTFNGVDVGVGITADNRMSIKTQFLGKFQTLLKNERFFCGCWRHRMKNEDISFWWRLLGSITFSSLTS